MAERGDRLVLLGRKVDDLERSARDLEIRGQQEPIGTALCDLLKPESFGSALDKAMGLLGGLDAVIVTAGEFATQERLEADPQLTSRMLTVNLTNTILFCEEARQRLMTVGGGTLCVFSSVAGERGRKPVVLYGASKAGLSRYLEGLDYRFRAQGLKTVCVKPGFVKTGMTSGLRPPPFAGDPDAVASRVLRALDRGQPEVYVPGIWRWVMAIIRILPRCIMRRLSF
jgi:short-subunit dehydrogenase